MSSTTEYDDSIEVITTRGGASPRLNEDSGYARSARGHHIMEKYCELGAENQLCRHVVTLDGALFNDIPPKRFILQSDEEIIRNSYANGRASKAASKSSSSYRDPAAASGTETCLIPAAVSHSGGRKRVEEVQTPDEKRVARMIAVVAGVLLLASFVLVGVTLSMSAHIDEMVKKMHTTTPYPVKISRTTIVYVNITNT